MVLGDKSIDLNDKNKVKIRALLAKNSKWEIFDETDLVALKQLHKNKNTYN